MVDVGCVSPEKGTLTMADSSTYAGELRDGRPHGRGVLTMTDRRVL